MDELVKLDPRDVERLDVSLEEMEQIASELGMVPFTKGGFSHLRALGLGMERAGVVRMANGTALVSVNALLLGIKKCQAKIAQDDISDDLLQKYTYALANLCNQLSRVTKNTVETDEAGRLGVEEANRRKRRSFPPGAVVVQIQNNIPKAS